MKHLLKLYKLVNYEFGVIIGRLLLICSAMILVTIFMLNSAISKLSPHAPIRPYEKLYLQTGGHFLFLSAFVLLLILFAHSIRSAYNGGSKSIYTFLTLPLPRQWHYWSKLSAFFIGVLLLYAAQLLTYSLGYSMYENHVSQYSNIGLLVHNGYFLSFIRSDFIRFLVPLSIPRLLSWLSLIITPLCGLYYFQLAVQSKIKPGLIVLPFVPYFYINMMAVQLFMPNGFEVKHLIQPSLILLAINLFFIFHSSWIIKKGAAAA